MAAVILKSGRDKPVRQRHLRLFAAAIKEVRDRPRDGDVVDVLTNQGEWLARGIINRQAQIAVRLLTWCQEEHIDDAFWHRRVAQAVQRRQADPRLAHTNARRWIFSESDNLPGVIADDYNGYVAVELSTLLALRAKDAIIAALEACVQPARIFVRGDEERLRNEFGGSIPRWVAEALTNPVARPERVAIDEHGMRFWVDLRGGQKTGFYLDQRDNRRRVAAYCADARVLNAFSYSGAFGVYALAGGARLVVNVDTSAEALQLAEANFALNAHLNPGAVWLTVRSDVFEDLRRRLAAGEQYDVVILDPPKFAHSPAQIERAARAYKDLNRLGLLLLRPGGILATFSCSGVVDAALFQKIVFSASLEAGREVRLVERLTQASDHPVLLTFPEGEYLKGFICRVE
ncbi:MAG: class I SAM-dependent rRNA methyltransferase [Thermoflexales bacterium]